MTAQRDSNVEKVLEIVCPTIRHNKCDHQDKQGRWDYWRADSGVCWCSKCGKCMNGAYERQDGFRDWKPNPWGQTILY